MNPLRRHLTYANVVATLALLFAMSGGALAASHYLINSTKQINPKVLKKLKGATGPQGKEGLQGKEGAQGKEGKEGKEGVGKEGPPGPVKLGAVKEIKGNQVEVEPGFNGRSTATCPAGDHVISGGELYETESTPPVRVESFAGPERKSWVLEVGNSNGATENIVATAIAYCVPEGEAVSG